VVGRIGAPQAGREDGDRLPTGIEATAMRGRINSMGAAGDHDAAGQCQPSAEFPSKREGVFVRAAGPNHRHSAAQLWKRPAEGKPTGPISEPEIQ
jgi:hypothetical protein